MLPETGARCTSPGSLHGVGVVTGRGGEGDSPWGSTRGVTFPPGAILATEVGRCATTRGQCQQAGSCRQPLEPTGTEPAQGCIEVVSLATISMRLWCQERPSPHTLHAHYAHRTHLVGSANIRIPRLPVDSSYSGFTGVEDKREGYKRDSFVARCCQAVSAVTRKRVTGEDASRKNKPSEPDCCQISSPHSACLQDPALIFSCKGATAFRSPFVYLSERYSEAAASDKQSTLIRRLL